MKILVISCDNIYLTPYLQNYIKIFEKNKVKYDVIYWDKNNNEKINFDNYHRFSMSKNNRFGKIIGYFEFRYKIKSLIRSNKYDMLLNLHQIGNLIIYDKLIKGYKKNYIYDVRDFSYEKYYIVRKMEKRLVNRSAINIISSEGFKKFLPKGVYNITHNFPRDNCIPFKQYVNKKKGEKIVISYIGLIRFMEQNKKIIDFFKNDSRFQLNFIGTNADKLQNYCNENNIHNVNLMGTFDNKETLNFYKDTDLVMNLYGNNDPLLDYAISNKLYYSALLYKPILVCENTYMESISSEYNFGYVLDLDDKKTKENLYEYVTTLDRKSLIYNCDKFIEKVKNEQKITNNKIEGILNEKIR